MFIRILGDILICTLLCPLQMRDQNCTQHLCGRKVVNTKMEIVIRQPVQEKIDHVIDLTNSLVSWCGQHELNKGDFRSAWMKSTSLGILYLVWSIVNIWGGFAVFYFFPQYRDYVYDACYIVSMIIICNVFNKPTITIVVMGLAYWIVGRSYIPIRDFPILALLGNLFMFLAWEDTQIATVICAVAITKKVVSRPSIWVMNPCMIIPSLFFVALYVMILVLATIQLLHPHLIPFFFFPFTPIEHEFSPRTTTLLVNFCSMLFFGFFIFISMHLRS